MQASWARSKVSWLSVRKIAYLPSSTWNKWTQADQQLKKTYACAAVTAKLLSLLTRPPIILSDDRKGTRDGEYLRQRSILGRARYWTERIRASGSRAVDMLFIFQSRHTEVWTMRISSMIYQVRIWNRVTQCQRIHPGAEQQRRRWSRQHYQKKHWVDRREFGPTESTSGPCTPQEAISRTCQWETR